jgi:hypothetical protein
MITGVGIGDVLVVRTADMFSGIIRLEEGLAGIPNLGNHLIVLDHQDRNGRWWGIAGQPVAGVSWHEATPYLNSSYTITNRLQPKTDEQRQGVALVMRQMLKTKYDNLAILEDAMRAVHLQISWDDMWNTAPSAPAPGAVVCSSVAVWAHHKNNLAFPAHVDMAHVQPGDWTEFILSNHYN